MPTKTLVVGPRECHKHTHTIIFLHGKGSNCDEFAEEFFESEASELADRPRMLPDIFPTIRWVFPSAPLTHSERFGCIESQWFDMWSLENPNEKVELQIKGLRVSIELVMDIVKREQGLVPLEHIFLGGISQGFATAYSTYCINNMPFAGLIGLCSWTPSRALSVMDLDKPDISETPRQARRATPVFLGHSKDDNVVPVQEGRKLRDTLKDCPDTVVEWKEYDDGGHWVNEPQGVDDIVGFLRRNMNEMSEHFQNQH
ncbi:phospholipase/carboxylesterase [Xylariaceae sp. FL0662B]|nr:phospholipase/carboxylesterase [Xylariaceae sp. FL0662B]